MVTMKKSQGQTNEYYGLHSDTKPSPAPNASTYLEMDTGAVFFYDAKNDVWIEV